jgi:hypothetical protein
VTLSGTLWNGTTARRYPTKDATAISPVFSFVFFVSFVL